MGLAHQVMKKVGGALSNVHAGDEKLALNKLVKGIGPTIEVTSSAFGNGQRLPDACSAAGGSHAPPIAWRNAPPHTKSVVVLCEDPDAPLREPYVHWIAYGMASSSAGEGRLDAPAPREGKNSKLDKGFTGAAPPPGHGVHHYHFQVFALDKPVTLEPGAGRSVVLEAMKNHVLAWGELVGTYEQS